MFNAVPFPNLATVVRYLKCLSSADFFEPLLERLELAFNVLVDIVVHIRLHICMSVLVRYWDVFALGDQRNRADLAKVLVRDLIATQEDVVHVTVAPSQHLLQTVAKVLVKGGKNTHQLKPVLYPKKE